MPGSLTISHKERYPGVELCCDSCNDLLDIICYYYRAKETDVFAWGCVCQKCAEQFNFKDTEIIL